MARSTEKVYHSDTKEYGPIKTYRALNGHMMDGHTYRYGYVGEWRVESWSAMHSDKCNCWTSDEGYIGMEDW